MDLQNTYKTIKSKIDDKEDEFFNVWNNNEVFYELIFCLCTPQTRAQAGWNAVTELRNTNILFDGNEDEIAEVLSKNGVRYKNKKAKYILEAKSRFMDRKDFSFRTFIENMLQHYGQVETRNWFASKIKGYGMKEASHFLRNIGQGDELCILDRHILRELDAYGVVSFPKKFTSKEYLEIEREMIKYAKEIQVPVFALDFVFWAETHNGEIFK